MNGSVIECNLMKQFLIGLGYFCGSASFCFGPISIVVHFRNLKTAPKMFSFYNEFAKLRGYS